MAFRSIARLLCASPRAGTALGLLSCISLVAGCQSTGDDGIGPDDDNPVISITVTPNIISIQQGDTELLTVRITRGGGYQGSVNFVLDMVPADVQGTVRDATTSGSVTTAVLELAVGVEAEPGTYDIAVRGTGSGVATVTAPLELQVEPRPVPVISLAVDPTSASVEQGQSTDVEATMTRENGIVTPPPTFDVSGLPDGVTWSNTDPVETSEGPVSTLTFDVDEATEPDTYDLTVTVMSEGAEDATADFELTVTPKPVPVPVRFGPNEVMAGSATTCRHFFDSGDAYCWGLDHKGQVGEGTPNADWEPLPKLVAGGHTWSWIVTGATHTCGLDDAGKAWCWGDDGRQALGNGPGVADAATPVAVAGDRTYVGIDAGSSTTCALEEDGTAWCWGWDFYEQIGNGDEGDEQPEPVQVSGDISFAAIAVGGTYTCGLDVTGRAWCWGNDGYGELGNGEPIQNENVPVEVSGGMTFLEIAVAAVHTCALDEAGSAYCWGRDLRGGLGDGPGSPDLCGSSACSHTPVAVAGGHTFTSLGGEGAGEHLCGLEEDGSAWCWGMDNYGQLGDGAGSPASCDGVPCAHEPIAVVGGITFRSISSGGGTTCGVDADGDTWCWGDDSAEQLGDGVGNTSVDSPKKITFNP